MTRLTRWKVKQITASSADFAIAKTRKQTLNQERMYGDDANDIHSKHFGRTQSGSDRRADLH
ncbi:hypothetical protein MPC4_100028 [Methylocella tundrae]|uniref:Uncharacterized protein n=1 Tax=Methylocella tundrae TaxID=227605 RepID=A0A8B6M1H3_METTU|nr:hypothetical protein MPC1_320008 [Methylocella tundrae]VTZ48585.1 hypothetical protein MPC4_100028 [Methylocella tundrae]